VYYSKNKMKYLSKITSLNKFIDFHYKSNIFIVVFASLSFIAFVLRNFSEQIKIEDIMIYSISSTVGIFLIWAIAVELDPARRITSIISCILLAGIILVFNPFDSYTSPINIAILLLLRMINGTSLRPPTFFDYFLTGFLSLILIVYGEYFLFGISFAVGFFLDYALNKKNKLSLLSGLILVIISFILYLFSNQMLKVDSKIIFIGILTGGLFYIAVLISSKKEIYKENKDNRKLDFRKMFITRITFFGFAWSALFYIKQYGAVNVYLLFMILLAFIITRFFRIRFK
jgi:hypothetical protein